LNFTLIAAVSLNKVIGSNGSIPWHIPEDLKYFQSNTLYSTVIMGRNTYESIGKPLPNRTTIIITRNKNYFKEGCLIANSLEQAIEMSKEEAQVFIIGGAQIYKETIAKDLAQQLDITLVHKDFEADVYFPEIDSKIWKEVARENFKADEKNKLDYSFISYQKI
jgi:dihydrofolate reductase